MRRSPDKPARDRLRDLDPAVAHEASPASEDSTPERDGAPSRETSGDQLPSTAPSAEVPFREDIRHTRISGAWAAVAVAALLGVALVDFIVENTRSVRVNFFSVHGDIPVAVALLAASLAGAFVVLGVGISRTTQLRIALRRKNRRARAHRRASVGVDHPGGDVT